MMKKKYLVIIGILLLLVGGYFGVQEYSNNNEKKLSDYSGDKIELYQTSKSNIEIIDEVFTWNELGIVPVKNLEGNHYVFSAFDFDSQNNELIIAKSSERNTLNFIKGSENAELEILDIPLDIIVNNSNVFVLGLNNFLVIENKVIKQKVKHNIQNVTAFDKLIFFQNHPIILMADGSSYKFENNKLNKLNSLEVDNAEIWIQKTSSNSFEIKSNPTDSRYIKQAEYPNEIGSITFLGETFDECYVILDVVNYEGGKPNVKRELKSNIDSFKETIMELPKRKFSFIKNDIKVHGNTIYTVTISNTSLNLKSYNK